LVSLDEMEQDEWLVKRYEHWQHTAFLSALIRNIFRSEKERPFVPDDFMPVELSGAEKKEPRKQSWEEMLAKMQELQVILNK